MPQIHSAPLATLAAGSIYVGDNNGQPQLPPGKRAVLETDGGRLEVLTCSTVAGGLQTEGTYLDPTDFAQLNPALASPKLRRYRWKDTWAKVASLQGLLLLLSAVIGLAVAFVGLYFAVWGAKPTSAATVADRSITALAWVVAPVDQLDSRATPQQLNAARRQTHRRATAVARCLAQLGGHEAPSVNVPGVACKPTSPSWYRNKDNAAWFTLAAGVLAAIFAVLRLRGKYGFQSTPSAG